MKINFHTFTLLDHGLYLYNFHLTVSKCNGFTLFFLFYCNTSVCCLNRKSKSNVSIFTHLDNGLLCISFDVTAGECNVFTLLFFLFYCNTLSWYFFCIIFEVTAGERNVFTLFFFFNLM